MPLDLNHHDIQLNVVERLSHVDQSPMLAFACAAEGGTYYFASINLYADMGSEKPTIRPDRAPGSLIIKRDDKLLWKSGHIVNRGGGMGNEERWYFTDVPENLIPPYEDTYHDHGETGAIFAKNLKAGDLVYLRTDHNPHSSQIESLKREWDREKKYIDHLQDRLNTEQVIEEFKQQIPESNSFEEAIEKIHQENIREANEYLDKFSYDPPEMT